MGKGGIAVYQIDESGKYVYYYAHLNGYASDLKRGMRVEQGRTIGYVGATGNAEKTPPHLHFQIQHIVEGQPWWRGPVINPYTALIDGKVTELPPKAVPVPVPKPVLVAGTARKRPMREMPLTLAGGVKQAAVEKQPKGRDGVTR